MPARMATWKNPRVFFILSLIFLSGLVVGMGAMSLRTHRMHPAGASLRDGNKELLLKHLKTELDLTPQQSEQLDTILDDFFMYYHTLQAQLDDVRATGKQRILKILNDDQKKKFERVMSEFQDRQPLR